MVHSHTQLPQDLQDDRQGHVSMMPYLWTIVIDIAVFFAKYKYTKYGVIVHAILTMLVTIVTISTALPILFYKGIPSSQESTKVQRHQIIGLMVLFVIAVQILIGFFTKLSQIISWKNTYTIYLLSAMHKYLGYILLALSKIQVFLTLGLNPEVSQLFWILIGFEIVCVMLWLPRTFCFPTLQQTIIPNYRRIKNSIKKVQILSELQEKRQDLGVFANYVYNIQALKTLHPAGNYIIKTIGHRQFDRYLYGMHRSQKQSQISAHSHSFKALSLLGDPIAKLSIPSVYSGFDMDVIAVSISKIFKLSQQGEIYEVYFKNDYQNIFDYKGFTCLQQLGRFHSLTVDKVTRLYTSIGCISETNIAFLQRVYFQKKDISIRVLQLKTHYTDFQSTDQKGLKASDQLCFLIKKQEKGLLTSSLLERLPRKIRISCPRGEGLKIWQFRPGKIMIVAAGTGLYPFCDLIDLLFKYQLSKTKPGLKKQLQAADPILKNTFLTQFTFTFYLSVNYIDDIHPLTFAELNELCHNQKSLKLYLRVSKGSEGQRFKRLNKNIELVKDRFGPLLEQIIDKQNYEKILICGPPAMNKDFVKLFHKKSISEDKYMII